MEHPAPELSARPPAPPRATWTEGETWKLIRLWEDNLHLLRGEKHNTKVYAAIVDALRESGIIKTKKQVQGKLDNLTQRYRKELREHRTGSAATTWPFFRELHRFLGCLPSNDRSLTQEPK
ncbi:hypothetical protein HPB49_026537 [Dermacentor silvarum]|nr:hypothetical protein HPB49_026537 [Dermacentor silvarum]